MNSFKKDLMEAVALVSNIENKLKISSLNGNEKIILYSILMKERDDNLYKDFGGTDLSKEVIYTCDCTLNLVVFYYLYFLF